MKFIQKYRNLIIIVIVIIIISSIFILKQVYKKFNSNLNLQNENNTSNQRNHEYKLYNFGLESCEACEDMEPIYEAAKKDYADKLDFEYADVTYNVPLSNKYIITVVPTFIIVDIDGNVIRREIGTMSKEKFYSFIESVINR